jgi:hypothetical protein
MVVFGAMHLARISDEGRRMGAALSFLVVRFAVSTTSIPWRRTYAVNLFMVICAFL